MRGTKQEAIHTNAPKNKYKLIIDTYFMSPLFKNENGYRFSIFSNEEERMHVHVYKEKKHVKVRSIMPDGIFLSVYENDYYLSYNRLPWFRNAKLSDIFNVSMMGDDAIRWEALDVDLEIESLIHPEKYPLVMKRSIDEVF